MIDEAASGEGSVVCRKVVRMVAKDVVKSGHVEKQPREKTSPPEL